MHKRKHICAVDVGVLLARKQGEQLSWWFWVSLSVKWGEGWTRRPLSEGGLSGCVLKGGQDTVLGVGVGNHTDGCQGLVMC